MEHIGIDVHKRESQSSIVAESGELLEQRTRTEPERSVDGRDEGTGLREQPSGFVPERRWGASCPYTTVAPGDPGTRDDGLQGQADEAGARTARRWFLVGLPLALAYLVVVFRFHRGKAVAARDGESY